MRVLSTEWRKPRRTSCALGVALIAGLIAAACSSEESPSGPTPGPEAPAATVSATLSETPSGTVTTATPQPRKHENGTYTIVVSQGSTALGVRVEVAATLAQRQQGLMFRTVLGENEGMLFLFPRDVTTGFWMRNTYLPLDIAYIGSDLRVIGIVQGVPLDERVLAPPGPYRYVLEVNAGWFERHGLGVGAKVALPEGLPAAKD